MSNNYVWCYYERLLDKIPRNLGGHTVTINFPAAELGKFISPASGTDHPFYHHDQQYWQPDQHICGFRMDGYEAGLRLNGFYNGKIILNGTTIHTDGGNYPHILLVKDSAAAVELNGFMHENPDSGRTIYAINCPTVTINRLGGKVIARNSSIAGSIDPEQIKIEDITSEIFKKGANTSL